MTSDDTSPGGAPRRGAESAGPSGRVAEYLERMAYDGPTDPTEETLRRLHHAHLLAVPFENLDIHLDRPIVLDVDALFEKVVRRRRGGFCYELNGLFGWLLGELGFDATMIGRGVSAMCALHSVLSCTSNATS